MLVKFSELDAGKDFFSPEGSLCRKLAWRSALMLDSEDSAYSVGEVVPFAGTEVVEVAPHYEKERSDETTS